MKDYSEYSDESAVRCERVLATILRTVGPPWASRMCLVGGLVPSYLVESAAGYCYGHVGSTDVDVAISLAVPTEEGAYRTLESNLKRAGLRRDGWRWRAEVDGYSIVVELLGDDDETPSGKLFAPKIKPPAGGGKLSLLCVRGVELAIQDSCSVTREVELIDGALTTVDIRVPRIAPYIGLKADVYLDRREPKDVYDILFVLIEWPGGPRAAATDFIACKSSAHPFVRSALMRLTSEFASARHVGPRDYARFCSAVGIADQDTAVNTALMAWRQFAEVLRTSG